MIELAIVLFAPAALSYVTRKALTWASGALGSHPEAVERTQSNRGTA